MIHKIKAWVLTIVFLGMLCINPLVLATNKTLWQGSNGDLSIHWTETNITATQGHKILFSAEALARKAFEVQFISNLGKSPACEYRRTFSLLSLVGNVASMKDSFEQHCQALIHGFHRFTTVDFANPEKRVKLTDFFSESVILNTLLADPIIKKTLRNARITTRPSTLEALYLFLDKQTIVARDTEEGGKCQFVLPKNFLTQFAFHHINKNQAAVRIALSPATPACRWSHSQLGIYLPISPTFQTAFMQAQREQVGFLMNRVDKIVGKGNTTVHFSTDAYTPLSESGTRITTVFKASLRSAPSVQKNNLLTKLKKGAVLKTLGRTSFREKSRRYNNDYWYLVELENGKTGWIFGALTKRVDKKTGYPIDSRITTETEVYVNLTPNSQADIVETLGKGVIVKILTRSKHQDQVNNILDYWYQVELAKGKTGWVFGGKTMATDKKITIGTRVNVRLKPTRNASIVKTLNKGAWLDILARSKHQEKIGQDLDYWYQVQLNNRKKTGWIFGGLLMRSSMRMVMAEQVRMRSEPRRGTNIVETLGEGAIVYAHKRSKYQEKIGEILDYWYQVESANNNKGWIFGGLIMPVGEKEIISSVENTEEPPCHIPWILITPSMNQCSRLSYEATDKRLNDVYQQIITLLNSEQYRQNILEMGSPLYPYGEQKYLLIEAQKSWIQVRDKQCNFETFFNRGGTGFTTYESGCLEQLTTQRIEILENALKELSGNY
ncbi:SH3 domain-containing protein [Candidatus Parabeggiatoa sp. HSG14]|uniref:SH3 domain-containing protein n=1 Tax=Candidatus Parabeggiatoa sp. HSG14 TaxID=3055593 RepID=UPI0025A70ED1|nr:SH3 domain-containing protein [Thiotrichales bacterium HSG14]